MFRSDRNLKNNQRDRNLFAVCPAFISIAVWRETNAHAGTDSGISLARSNGQMLAPESASPFRAFRAHPAETCAPPSVPCGVSGDRALFCSSWPPGFRPPFPPRACFDLKCAGRSSARFLSSPLKPCEMRSFGGEGRGGSHAGGDRWDLDGLNLSGAACGVRGSTCLREIGWQGASRTRINRALFAELQVEGMAGHCPPPAPLVRANLSREKREKEATFAACLEDYFQTLAQGGRGWW